MANEIIHRNGFISKSGSTVESFLNVTGDTTANSFITVGGLSTEFVKGDGTLDSNTYLTSGDLIANTDDYLTGATFNTGDGVITHTLQSGSTVTVDIDGRYVTSIGVGAGLITSGGLAPNINLALSALTDGTADIVGADDEIIYLDNGVQKRKQVDEWNLSAFNNDIGAGGGTDDFVTGATFNTGDGVLTLTRQSGSTVTVDLDDRYSLTGHTHPEFIGDYLPLSGGTLTGGLTGTTIHVANALLDNQENLVVTTGGEVIATISKLLYDAAFFDYVVKDGTNLRSGVVMSCHDGTLTEYTDNSTNDLGDTSGVFFDVDISGNDLRLNANVSSGTWEIKVFIRGL